MNHFQKISDRPSIGIAPSHLIRSRLDADYYRTTFVDNEEALQASGYKIELLGNMWTEANYGSLPDSIDYSADGIFLIRGTDIRGYGISPENELVRVPAIYYQKFKKARVSPGDLLILVKGASIDREDSTAVVPENLGGKAIINGSIFKVKLKPEYDRHFIAAFMFSRYFLLQKRRSVTNTGALYNDLETIRSYQIVLPDPKIQAYIGDKVRLAEKCREEANRLWDDAKQLLADTMGLSLSAEAYQSYNLGEIQSDNYQAVSKTPVICWVHQSIVDDRLGAQFFHPRRENIILKLRDTCEVKKLSEVAVRVTKRTSAEKAAHLGYVGLSEIDSASGFFEPTPMEKAETVGVSSYFGSRDILFSKLRPYLNKVTICPDHIKEACGSTELLVYRAKRNILPYYLFFILKSNLGLFQIIDLTSGSTLPRVDPEIIDDLLIPLLPEQTQEEIDRKVRKTFYLLHAARNLINQSQSDVEALIENRLPVDQILSGILRSPSIDEVLTKRSLE